jgi:hypothetical protein
MSWIFYDSEFRENIVQNIWTKRLVMWFSKTKSYGSIVAIHCELVLKCKCISNIQFSFEIVEMIKSIFISIYHWKSFVFHHTQNQFVMISHRPGHSRMIMISNSSWTWNLKSSSKLKRWKAFHQVRAVNHQKLHSQAILLDYEFSPTVSHSEHLYRLKMVYTTGILSMNELIIYLLRLSFAGQKSYALVQSCEICSTHIKMFPWHALHFEYGWKPFS